MMPPEDIDDLFRDGLDGHATPPDPALWARLEAGPDAAADARLDELFRARLGAHATPPAREMWERLEDEHLRPPRKRRGAAGWPLALAAALALLLAAGGAGLLWRGLVRPRPATGLAVHSRAGARGPGAAQPAKTAAAGPQNTFPAAVAARAAETGAPNTRATRTQAVAVAPSKNISSGRATATHSLASSGSSAAKRAANTPAAGTRQMPEPTVATVRPAPAGAPAVAPIPPRTAPDAGPLAAASPPATASADAVPVIEVDVRRGGSPPLAAAAVAAAPAGADAHPGPRRLLGGLLRQAGHLARGERVSLAEAAGLPATLTLQANLGGRTLVRTIQL